MEEEKKEMDVLVDELVAKAGPTTGQIKANQDPVKVARLLELGWIPEVKNGRNSVVARIQRLEDTQKEIQKKLADHEKRIAVCSIQR